MLPGENLEIEKKSENKRVMELTITSHYVLLNTETL
jgi:hypothetical protein